MSNIYNLPNQEKHYDEACIWIAKMDEGLTDADRKDLQCWISASRENWEVLATMAELWDKMDSLSRLSDLFPQPANQRVKTPRFLITIAASVLVAVLVGVWEITGLSKTHLFNSPNTYVKFKTHWIYETAIGEHSTVSFPDGTRVVLNTDSLIKVSYTPHDRLFVLERGEIHIQVAEEKLRPLSVVAGNKVVQAVGTAFNVKMIKDEQVSLIVTEGKVRVAKHPQYKLNALRPPTLSQAAIEVSKGEEIILGSPTEEIRKIKSTEIAVSLSWREGKLIFRGESLGTAVAEISRYTPVEFGFLDDDLKKIRIAGVFKAGDINGLLMTLQKNFGITYQRINEQKVLLGTQ
jgi:transmembrane sensor